jgi:hypothetical protein
MTETTNKKTEQIADTVNKKVQEIGDSVTKKIENADTTEWLHTISEILERLAEKHPKVSLECNNVSFETEKRQDNGSMIPEGKMKIDGKFTLSVE